MAETRVKISPAAAVVVPVGVGLPPGDLDRDPSGPDALEDPDGLGVGKPVHGVAVDREDLVA